MRPYPLLTLLLASLAPRATAQSLLVPEDTVRKVFAVDAQDGSLQTAGYLNLDDGPVSSNRPYQAVLVGNELWVTDDVLSQITRWNTLGTQQLGVIDLAPHRLRGIANAFGAVWVAGGTPGGSSNDFLLELSPAGALLASHPMPGTLGGVVALGNELLVSDQDHDDLLRVDPASGTVAGTFHDSDGVTGIDLPGGLDVLPNGHVLAAGNLDPEGAYEYDAAGNQVALHDTSILPAFPGVVGVHGVVNGDIVVSNGDGIHVLHVGAGTFTTVLESVRPYYFSEVPDVTLGTSYCGPAVVNSSGLSGEIAATGSELVSLNALHVAAHNLPTTQFGYFLVARNAGFVSNPGGSQGNLCLSGAIGRYNKSVQFTGNDTFFAMTVDLTQIPQPGGSVAAVAGETWRFQTWFRDKNPNPTSNFTDAVAVTFQ